MPKEPDSPKRPRRDKAGPPGPGAAKRAGPATPRPSVSGGSPARPSAASGGAGPKSPAAGAGSKSPAPGGSGPKPSASGRTASKSPKSPSSKSPKASVASGGTTARSSATTAKPSGSATATTTGPADPSDAGPRVRPALTSRAAILAVVMCVIALSLAYPLREYIAQRAEIAELREQNDRARENVTELTAREEQLQRRPYIEQEARTRLHYQYPGERAYVVIGGSGDDDDEKAAPKSTEPWFTQLWKSVKKADETSPEREVIPEAQPPDH